MACLNMPIEKLKEHVKANKYSVDAWNILVRDVQDRDIDDATRQFFEELVEIFPLCAKYWQSYIEHELKAKNYDIVEQLFHRSLHIPNVGLWKCYLNYLTETKVTLPNYTDVLIEAYELALKNIGIDYVSYSVWNEYLKILISRETSESISAEVKEQLTQKIRLVYQEVFKHPKLNISELWKGYCEFEEKRNDAETSRRLIDASREQFELVARLGNELEDLLRRLKRHLPAVPPGSMASIQEELKQIGVWKKYFSWEKRNPLKLTDRLAYLNRVIYAFEQSFLSFSFHCDFWLQATSFLCRESKKYEKYCAETTNGICEESRKLAEFTMDTAGKMYERAATIYVKNNPLIYLCYADFEERRTNYMKANEIYEKCLANENIDPTLIWIHFVRFVRRTEDISAARKIFKRAREDPRTTYQLIIANADLEYFYTKDKTIGFRIYAIAGKKFAHEAEYMLSYLNYMSHLNEDNNTRVLFERILSSDDLPLQKSHEIWSEFLKFECAVGDLASILKVDKKRQNLFEISQTNNTPGIEQINQNTLMIDRYKYLDLYPASPAELKSMGYKESGGAKKPAPIWNYRRKNMTAELSKSPNVSSLSSLLQHNTSVVQHEYCVGAVNEARKLKFPSPDTTQMLPFKPVRSSVPGIQSLAGGVFPFPPAVTELVKRLPPPTTFEGPFVIIDELIRLFQECELNPDFQPSFVYLNGQPIREMDYMNHQHHHYSDHPKQSGYHHHKRGMQHSPKSDDEDHKKSRSGDGFKHRHRHKFGKN